MDDAIFHVLMAVSPAVWAVISGLAAVGALACVVYLMRVEDRRERARPYDWAQDGE